MFKQLPTISEDQDLAMPQSSEGKPAAEESSSRKSRPILVEFLQSRAQERVQRREANGRTSTHTHNGSDSETAPFRTQSTNGDSSLYGVSLDSTAEENSDVVKHRSSLEESIGHYGTVKAAAQPLLLQPPQILITAPTYQTDTPASESPRQTHELISPNGLTSQASDTEVGKYGKILHDTLVILVDKQQCIVEMEKDLKIAQEKMLHAYDEVTSAQQKVVDSQDRVVKAHEELLRGLRLPLDEMQKLRGEVEHQANGF